MAEENMIPIAFLTNTLQIDPTKLPKKLTLKNSIQIFSLSIRTKQTEIAKEIFNQYVNTERERIYECFHNPEMADDVSAKEVRNVIYEYLAFIPIKSSKVICKQLQLRYNYCVFKYAMDSANIPLLKWFAFKGYPRRIKRGNTEVYYIINTLIKAESPCDLFVKIISNVFKTYKGAKISMYSFLNLLDNDYKPVAELFKHRIDTSLFTGQLLDQKIQNSKNDKNTFSYLNEIGFYKKYEKYRMDNCLNNDKEIYVFRQSQSEGSLVNLDKHILA